jgi:hypothetical protein
MLALEYFNLMAPSLISPQKGYIITLPNYTAWQAKYVAGQTWSQGEVYGVFMNT